MRGGGARDARVQEGSRWDDGGEFEVMGDACHISACQEAACSAGDCSECASFAIGISEVCGL